MQEGRKLKVLVAADSNLIREHIKKTVSELGNCEIAGEAGDGLEAISLIYSLMPDVVILDIGMPKASGIKVLNAIKDLKKHPVVIVLTGNDHTYYRRKCLEAGASFFFSKFNEFNSVLEVLRRLDGDKNLIFFQCREDWNGGKIYVKSRKGGGFSFSVELPAK